MQANQSKPLNLIKSPQETNKINSSGQMCHECNSEYCILRKYHEYRSENTECSTKTNSKVHQHTKDATGKAFQCTICLKRFSRKSSLQTHGRLHSDTVPQYECHICLKLFKWKSNLRVHYAIHTNQKYVCEFCQKVFAADKIEQHRMSHLNPQTQCQYCEKAFSNQYKVNYHKRMKHPDVTTWQCQYCSESFDTAINRRTHIYNHHKEKNFKCGFCLKKFLTQHNLTQHESKHTKYQSFQCEICSQKFSYKRNLYTHMLRHVRKPTKNQFETNSNCSHELADSECVTNCLRDVDETTGGMKDFQVKIGLVSDCMDMNVIPLFEINIPKPTNELPDIEPVVLVQAFTRPSSCNSSTYVHTLNESIDFLEQQRIIETIVIDTSSDEEEIIIDYSLTKMKQNES